MRSPDRVGRLRRAWSCEPVWEDGPGAEYRRLARLACRSQARSARSAGVAKHGLECPYNSSRARASATANVPKRSNDFSKARVPGASEPRRRHYRHGIQNASGSEKQAQAHVEPNVIEITFSEAFDTVFAKWFEGDTWAARQPGVVYHSPGEGSRGRLPGR